MKLINLIFPKKCAFCGDFSVENVLCGICASKYEQIKRTPCRRCGAAHLNCRCKPEKLLYEDRVSCRHLFAFEGEMAKTLIYKIKRKNISSLRKFFASECAALIKSEQKQGEEYFVSYAPRAKSAVLEYGFDQAELLAHEIAKALKLDMEDIFIREDGEDTQQKTLGATEREKNAKRAFSLCEGADIEGKTLILLDDVTTTGSTAKRLCELVLSAGAKNVLFISIAKA